MNLADLLVILAVLALVIWAAAIIRKSRKKGEKCVGCPYSSSCGGTEHCTFLRR